MKLAQSLLADSKLARDLFCIAMEAAAVAMQFADLAAQMGLLRAHLLDMPGGLSEGAVISFDRLLQLIRRAMTAG
jgi:hypothetical protein